MKLSETTGEVFKALAQFRANILQPKKDADNPQFRSKYVPLENVTDVIDKVAPQYGLAYVQNLNSDEYLIGVQTLITHESGEYIMSDWLHLDSRPILKGGAKGNFTSQSQGSAITYGRRYSLASAFGIASEVDDDGNEASGNSHENQVYQPNQPPQQQPQQPGQQQLAQEFKESRNKYYTEIHQLTGISSDEITEMVKGKLGATDLSNYDYGKQIGAMKEVLNDAKRYAKQKAGNE